MIIKVESPFQVVVDGVVHSPGDVVDIADDTSNIAESWIRHGWCSEVAAPGPRATTTAAKPTKAAAPRKRTS